MKRIVSIALLALAACGSPSQDSGTAATPARPPNEYFVWDDPSAAGGNFDADYADCKTPDREGSGARRRGAGARRGAGLHQVHDAEGLEIRQPGRRSGGKAVGASHAARELRPRSQPSGSATAG